MNVAVAPETTSLSSVEANPPPDGARVGMFETSDRKRLRYATFAKGPGAPRGTVCLVQGRTEFIEKYFETIADFQSRGFAVATFDWRGQGGSQRLIGNPRLGHVNSFEDYWTDLRSFHGSILLPDCPAPYFLVGHSMGGLAALYAGIRDRLMFERIFLSTPMVGLDRQPLSMAGMATLAGALKLLGLGRLPAGRPSDRPQTEHSFAGNPLTSDLRRFTRSIEIIKARPELEIGVPTIGWAAAAFSAMAGAALDSFPVAVRIPVLMLAAARDRVVSSHAIETLGLRMRSGRHTVIAGARHELFMETDAIRGQVFAAFDAFITERTS